MVNFDYYTNENKTEHNPKWPYISDHPYRILLIGGSGLGKTDHDDVRYLRIRTRPHRAYRC